MRRKAIETVDGVDLPLELIATLQIEPDGKNFKLVAYLKTRVSYTLIEDVSRQEAMRRYLEISSACPHYKQSKR